MFDGGHSQRGVCIAAAGGGYGYGGGYGSYPPPAVYGAQYPPPPGYYPSSDSVGYGQGESYDPYKNASAAPSDTANVSLEPQGDHRSASASYPSREGSNNPREEPGHAVPVNYGDYYSTDPSGYPSASGASHQAATHYPPADYDYYHSRRGEERGGDRNSSSRDSSSSYPPPHTSSGHGTTASSNNYRSSHWCN